MTHIILNNVLVFITTWGVPQEGQEKENTGEGGEEHTEGERHTTNQPGHDVPAMMQLLTVNRVGLVTVRRFQ
ncbi:hypothetical protein Pmani_038776 [Petrolisthes manimaculis]|uniref:Uncharacterized protein n=1 Tax=Petrolisthes manimaculis TaxID=1843537 RepID=A0AAE1NDP7_9EUCA|nr:hypothetical protein Pmani_038776 [Petrolisthes manimaculis]